MCLTQQARLQRGNLLLKQGKLDEAESDFKKVVSKAIPPFKENYAGADTCERNNSSPGGVSVDLWP